MMEYAELIWDENEEDRSVFLEQLAPIVLFTYNRLEHTKLTIEALQQNIYAADSHLIIFSDGPKNSKITKSVIAVREYLSTIKGFKSIKIIERDDNWGLARNIIDGVTKIVNKYGKIIVLEDDIVTSKYFLKYMNDALKIYEHDKYVMEISGYMCPMESETIPQTFFLNIGDCWGWGTWKASWDFFERDPEKLKKIFSKKDIYHFNFEGKINAWQQVIDNSEGKLYTWAVFWAANIFKQGGYMLAPKKSLVNNVGLDGSGEHCEASSSLNNVLENRPITYFPLKVEENNEARQAWGSFFKSTDKRFLFRIKYWLKFLLRSIYKILPC